MIFNAFLKLLNLFILLFLEFPHLLHELTFFQAFFSVYLCPLLRELLEVQQVLDPELLHFQELANCRVRVLTHFIVKIGVHKVVQVVSHGLQVPLHELQYERIL